jgi:hypothetical protein
MQQICSRHMRQLQLLLLSMMKRMTKGSCLMMSCRQG